MKAHLRWIWNHINRKYIQCEERHFTSAMRSFRCQKETGHFGKCIDSLGRTLIPNNEPKQKKQKTRVYSARELAGNKTPEQPKLPVVKKAE